MDGSKEKELDFIFGKPDSHFISTDRNGRSCSCFSWPFVYGRSQKEDIRAFFLKCVLAVLLGFIASDVTEKIILFAFSKDLEVTVNSSAGLFFDRLKTGWENGYVLNW